MNAIRSARISACSVSIAGLLTLLTSLASAQSAAKGEWRCANDKPDSVQMPPPAENARVSTAEKAFAKGSAEAMLAKGGPTGALLWAHLHGIHGDRHGKTNYKMIVLVKDKGGYYYVVTPPLDMDVKGVLDKNERHRHCFGQFILASGTQEAEFLKLAVDGNVPLEVQILGVRDRNDWVWLADEAKRLIGEYDDELLKLIGGYFGLSTDAVDLLKTLNKGKSPQRG